MKLSSQKVERGYEPELSLTSMIDVVFLLLIFFVVTAAFVKTERELDSLIKFDKAASAASHSDIKPVVIRLVTSGGSYVYQIGQRRFTTSRQLEDFLRVWPHKQRGAFVFVSDGSPFGMAATAIQACRSADFLTATYVPYHDSN